MKTIDLMIEKKCKRIIDKELTKFFNEQNKLKERVRTLEKVIIDKLFERRLKNMTKDVYQ